MREFLAGEFPRGGHDLVRGCRCRHGKHDVVNEFRRPPRRSSIFLTAVLAGGEFQVPLIEQLLVLFRVSDKFALVGLDLQGASPADIREVSRHRTPLRSSASHFHHDLRRTRDRARDVCNLLGTESARHLPTTAPVTDDVEETRSNGRHAKHSSSQCDSPM